MGIKLGSYNSVSPTNSNNLKDLYAPNHDSPDKCFQLGGDFDDEIDVGDLETEEEERSRKTSSSSDNQMREDLSIVTDFKIRLL